MIEEDGACTKCQSNTATLKTLFPEYAKQAICTNKACYNSKCDAYFRLSLINAFQKFEPESFLFNSEDVIDKVVLWIPEATNLPKYNLSEVNKLSAPEMPDKDDYTNIEDDDETDEPMDGGFAWAMHEYYTELEDYRQMIENGHALRGLYISHNKIEHVFFTLEQSGNRSYI